MGVQYTSVIWNRRKKQYDSVLLGMVVLYLAVFALANLLWHPEITIETLIIRATGTAALLLLHIILLIGPLARLNKQFLPLLYNRRHLGVTMFFLALIHGVFSLIQFHALGDTSLLLSLFQANPEYTSIGQFPFEVLGLISLLILFLMAATSHDFWLQNLGPKVWKVLHMMVYLAYFALLLHVLLGILQLEKASINFILLGLGAASVTILHLVAGWRETGKGRIKASGEFIKVCQVDEIDENRAKVFLIGKENIALFKYDGKLSAINNVCKHQNGPLGEGKVVDGCITCPWHGYQYLPENGASPPPFTEKVSTYQVKLEGSDVFINPTPFPEGTALEPAKIPPHGK